MEVSHSFDTLNTGHHSQCSVHHDQCEFPLDLPPPPSSIIRGECSYSPRVSWRSWPTSVNDESHADSTTKNKSKIFLCILDNPYHGFGNSIYYINKEKQRNTNWYKVHLCTLDWIWRIFFTEKPPVCPSRHPSYNNSLRSNPCSTISRQTPVCPSVSRSNSDTMRRRGLDRSHTNTLDRRTIRSMRSCSDRSGTLRGSRQRSVSERSERSEVFSDEESEISGETRDTWRHRAGYSHSRTPR